MASQKLEIKNKASDNDDVKKEPIINNPYETPKCHRGIDGRGKSKPGKISGRRPSGSYETVPKAEGTNAGFEFDTRENEMPYSMINRIRKQVSEWKNNEYPGISDTTRKLLLHWSNPETSGTSPYFCQRDAVETAVYLVEADASQCPKVDVIRKELLKINDDMNSGIYRLAIKMATATGKTWVMAMLILWNTFRTMGKTGTVILTPGRTVRSRLDDDLNEESEHSIYDELLPKNMSRPKGLKVRIYNYQQFQPKQKEYFDTLSPIAKKVIMTGRKDKKLMTETYNEMLSRILRDMEHFKKLFVINDEAHHCFQSEHGGSLDRKEGKRVDMWFTIIKKLNDQGRLENVIDMSATPMYSKIPTNGQNLLFPWIVSDYPLIDAIEAGLTKIPILPVSDDSAYEEPIYRKLFSQLKKPETKLDHTDMNQTVKDMLEELGKKYVGLLEKKGPDGIPPVMIVVANDIKNAGELYQYIAGYLDEDGKYVGGHIPQLSNVSDDEKKPADITRTVLVHSKIDDGITNEEIKEINRLQERFIPKKDMSNDQYMDHIRKIFGSVGKPGKEGEEIRCVVSISMLTEGWDVKTVSQIFGFRPFESQLLCEQVAGRSLRRTVIPSPDSGIPNPEYAEIYGIPFSFMEKSEIASAPKKETYNVRSIDGNRDYRISFPNVIGYTYEVPEVIIKINLEKLGQFTARPGKHPTTIKIEGVAGQGKIITTKKNTHIGIIYKIAAEAVKNVKIEPKNAIPGNGLIFSSMVGCVKKALKSGKIVFDNIDQLGTASNLETVATNIAEACFGDATKGRIKPKFPRPGQPKVLDTSSVDFNTSEKNRYPTKGNASKSEINIAACDSAPEVKVARILDEHPGIGAWVRNHRKMDWYIPYFDPKAGTHRYYGPDFVARLESHDEKYLIIEYKGQAGGDSRVKQDAVERYWIPAIRDSEDPACFGIWRYLIISEEMDSLMIRKDIDRAIQRLAGEENGS